ncbi:MAG: ribosomal protein S18-alanine N-acetyltransferase [Pseudanabaenaceae cyanobacterium]
MTPIVLERLQKALLPQIKAIDRAGLGDFWSLASYEQELTNPNSYLIGAITAAKLLGFGCLWRIVEEAHITVLVVHPDYQGQGIGKLLVWGLLAQAHYTGAEWAVLEVEEFNQTAIKLYEYFDFTEVGRRQNYYQHTGASALVMWRKGLQSDLFPGRLQEWWGAITEKLRRNGWSAQNYLKGKVVD